MTSEIKTRIIERNRLRSIAVKTTLLQDWKSFRTYRNILKTDMIAAKKAWMKSQLTRENPNEKTRWRQIKMLTGMDSKTSTAIELDVNGSRLTDPKEVAEHLNNFYVKKVQDITDTTPPNPTLSQDYTQQYLANKNIKEQMEFRTVSIKEVRAVISSLKMTSSVGHDDISTLVFKRFKDVLAPLITRLVNLAIMTSRYPKTWKYGVISPVFKKGDKRLDKNWRLVTLLCCMSKILNIQIKEFMTKYHLISLTLHAYQRHKSCMTAWADIDTIVNKALDNGYYVGLLFVDMSSAFNLVSKHIVIPKLKMLGVGPYASKLIESYLTGRQSVTKISGTLSKWIQVLTGIGEGSVLGPLIFILTVIEVTMVLVRAKERLQQISIEADLDDGQHKKDVSLSSAEFVDDCTGIAVCKKEQHLQVSLQILSDEYTKYFEANGLKINVTKSEHMVIGKQRTTNVVIDGRNEASEVKLLGITFSNKYTYYKHVTNVANKMASRMGQLSSLVPYADTQTSKMLANSIIVSVANYGAEIYSSDKKCSNRIQVKINQAMRIVTQSDMRTPIRDMLLSLDWLKFDEIVKYNKVMLFAKIMSLRVSPYCFLLIYRGMNQVQTRYHVRERDLRIAWRPLTVNRGDKSFLVTATKHYNKVKVEDKQFEDKDDQKAYVKHQIKSWR